MPKIFHFHYDNGKYVQVHAPWQMVNELTKDGDTEFIVLANSKPAFKLSIEEISDEQENETQAKEEPC